METSSSPISFIAARDIPPLTKKVILVTGGTAGLGKQSILEFAKHDPGHLWLAARNVAKAQETVNEVVKSVPNVRISILELDLGSLASVQRAASQFLGSSSRLDVLLNNAGIMAHPESLTKDGYELQFGTNFLGHALLIRLLLPIMQRTALQMGAGGRSHARAPPAGIVFESLKTDASSLSAVERYGQSKLANILYAKELAYRIPDIRIASVNPGMVRTGLTNVMGKNNLAYRVILSVLSPIMGVSVEEGVKAQLWACTAKDVRSGEYYSRMGETGKGSPHTRDHKLQDNLWDWTQKELDAFLASSQS
ncbi:Short-chain dehydrogenase/reductase SDR [Fusarium oxysporum f. sp. vasinfectum]|nr:Short-chain dehydrogenase/reductase SDR [Fusarium oxysporum f. sp. vasinfectum]